MARVLQENLKKLLANELLFSSLVSGGAVKVKLDKDKKQLTYHFLSASMRKAAEGRCTMSLINGISF